MTQPVTTKFRKNTTGFTSESIGEISAALNQTLADVFTLYLKTKSFHWHVTGPHFRDYHLLLDEQAGELLAATDAIAERVRKIGGATLHSIGDITRHQRLHDNDAEQVEAQQMLTELRDDNMRLVTYLRSAHETCARYGDVATTSLIEVWIDEAERRSWFLAETVRQA